MSAWTSHNTRFTKSILLSFLVLGLGCSDTASNNQTNNQSNNGSNNTTKQTNNSTGSTTSTSSTTLTSGTTTSDDGTPQISNLPSLESVAIKLFRFGWEDVSDATYYQILENKDGDSDFVQVGEDVLPGVKTIDIEVPLCLRTNAVYKLRSCNDSGCTDSEPVNVSGNLAEAIGYFKAENAGVRDFFGSAIALSADGKLLAVGAPNESSRDNSDETDDAWVEAGAVYIFTQSNGKWTQQAFLKASNADRYDNFGEALSLTSDGNTLVVGAPSEDGRFANDPSDNSRPDSGAAYVFEREGSTWTETKYIKLEKDVQGRAFGQHVHISDDGLSIIAVEYNPFGGTSVNLLTKSNDEWVLEPGFSKPNAGDIRFAVGTAFSNTGTVVAVGAAWESSDAIGIGGDPDNENLSRSGAVFLYELENGVWGETYIKADIPVERTEFGLKVRLSGDGETLAVMGLGKIAAADTDIIGLIYLYKKINGVWELNHKFPSSVYTNFSDMSLNEDGSLIALSLEADQSSSAGLNGDRTASESTYGAAFVHQFDNGAWTEVAYVKASNPSERDNFGRYLFMGNDGTLVVGVPNEASSATGVGRDQNNEDAEFSGAVYLY